MPAQHGFVARYTKELEWQEDTDLLQLPKGVQVKILSTDPETGRIDLMAKFPPGYVEPRHTHASYHSLVVLEGLMRVEGYDLRPGDYVFGWDEEHGPFEYPEGCTVFTVTHGNSLVHQFDPETVR